jgi:hypothetical protein
VTRDSDYFYEPAVAIMYVTFVGLLLTAHLIRGRREVSELEYLLNALQQMEELARHDLDEAEAERVRSYLERSDPTHPLVAGLRSTLRESDFPPPRFSVVARTRERFRALYRKTIRLPWFDQAVILVFAGQLALKLLVGAVFVYSLGASLDAVRDWQLVGWLVERTRDLSGLEIAQLVASGVSGVFVLLGVARVARGARLAAYQMFERAILVSILLVQVFSFYAEQFAALVELAGNLVLLLLVRSMIRLEEERIQA